MIVMLVFLLDIVLAYCIYRVFIKIIKIIINKIFGDFTVNFNDMRYVVIGNEKIPIGEIVYHKYAKDLYWVRDDGRFHYSVINDTVYVVSYVNSLLYYSGVIN